MNRPTHEIELSLVENSVRNRPKLWVLVCLLAGAALVISYLGAYAASDALVASEVLRPFSTDSDPRPLWLACGFLLLLSLFLCIMLLARIASRRQLREIDQMEEPE